MEKVVIDREVLSREIKKFLCDLINKGNNVVEITEFNAELQRILRRIPGEAAIEWNDVAKVGLPVVSGEYIVMIAYAEKPTVLCYDDEDQVFFEEYIDSENTYKVTHWAELPGGPNV